MGHGDETFNATQQIAPLIRELFETKDINSEDWLIKSMQRIRARADAVEHLQPWNPDFPFPADELAKLGYATPQGRN